MFTLKMMYLEFSARSSISTYYSYGVNSSYNQQTWHPASNVNETKAKIIHFRTPVMCSAYLNDKAVEQGESYK